MPVRRKPSKKYVEHVEPDEKAQVVMQLGLVVEEAKKLDADIQELAELLERSYFRLL